MAFKSKVTASIGLSGSPSTVTNTVASGASHTIIGLAFANVGSANVTVSAVLNKDGGSSAFLIKDAIVPLGGALALVGGDQKVVLEAGDTVTAYASAASSIDSTLSYLV